MLLDGQFTLGELINRLKVYDENAVPVVGLGNPHSYRGYYNQLAFEAVSGVSFGAMEDAARSAVGTTYQGYKGGDYTMQLETPVWVASYGSTGGPITGFLLHVMEQSSKQERVWIKDPSRTEEGDYGEEGAQAPMELREVEGAPEGGEKGNPPAEARAEIRVPLQPQGRQQDSEKDPEHHPPLSHYGHKVIEVPIERERRDTSSIYIGYNVATGRTEGGRPINAMLAGKELIVQVGSSEFPKAIEDIHLDLATLIRRMIGDPGEYERDNPGEPSVPTVRWRVEQIRQEAHDPDLAHGAEDILFQEVLQWVAETGPNRLADVAAEALKTSEIDFPRWTA